MDCVEDDNTGEKIVDGDGVGFVVGCVEGCIDG
jgi:hypothetical protein